MNHEHIELFDTEVAVVEELPQQPRIAFIYIPDDRPVFTHAEQLAAWMYDFSELDMLCDRAAFFVKPPQQNDGFQSVASMCQQIDKIYDQFDGFVLIFPRDRVLAASAILSLLVVDTGKPIICTSDYATGMQTRYRDYYSIAFKSDMVNTAHVGSADIGAVVAMAGQEIVHPALSTVAYNSNRPFITSATTKYMGVVDFGLHIYSRTPKRTNHPLHFEQWNLNAVQRIHVTDRKRFSVTQKDFIPRPDARGLIAEISGVAPLSLLTVLPKHIPVLITSEAGTQLALNGSVASLQTPYTNHAVVAQFVRILSQQKSLPVSVPGLVKAMRQQVFPTLTAGL